MVRNSAAGRPESRRGQFITLIVVAVAGFAFSAFAVDLDVTRYGAVGDGATVNTNAIQQTIDACHAQGGGSVQFPAGRFVTGTIRLAENVTLRLAEQAVLLGSTNPADYLNADPFTAGDGLPQGHALIVAVDARHVGVEGAGVIDGQGPALKAAQKPFAVRPFLLRWIRCEDVTLDGVTLRNPGAWTNHFFQCRNVVARGLTIRSHNPGLGNNDGLDIDSCEGVRVSGCDIDSGDDSVCIKSTSARPCRDVAVADCKLRTRCNAIKLGTESLGGFEHIRVSHCELRDVGMTGIALYTVDGGDLRDVVVENITMDKVNIPINVRLGARLKTFRAGDQAKTPASLRDVTIKNVRATGARIIGIMVNGIPEHPVEAIALEAIRIELPGGGTEQDAGIRFAERENAYPEWNMFGPVTPASGIYMRHVRGAHFQEVMISTLKPDSRPEKVFIDVEDVTPAGFAN